MIRPLNKTRTRVAMMITIIAVAGSIVTIYDGLTFLGTTTADSASWTSVAAGPSDGTHSFAATDSNMAGNTSAAWRPESRTKTVAPSITSFSATPRTDFLIGDDSYEVETAGQSYSLTNPDPQTLRFEIQPGDHAWFDSSSVDRSEVEGRLKIPAGTPISIAYEFMLEPGATNTATWFVTGQMHNDDWALGPNVGTSPPFAIELAGEHLRVVARHCPTGLDPSNRAGNLKKLTLWTDPNPIQRGQYYDIEVQANVSNTSSGYLEVWVNGKVVVNYHGPLGYGTATYWKEGLYRSANASQTVAANFRDLIVRTRSSTLGVSPR
jgi:hypothetical protein